MKIRYTVPSDQSRVAYSGNGSTQVFPVPYVFFDDTDLNVVLVVTATGVETPQVLTTNYTVSGGDGENGSITMLVAPPTGSQLVIEREIPFTQEIDYEQNDPFPADVNEEGLDRNTMLAQQVYRRARQSPKLPATFDPENGDPVGLPLPVAGQVLIGKTDETGWENTAIASVDPGLTPLATQEQAETGTNNSTLSTPLRVFEAIRVIVTHVSAAEKRFAGGVKMNKIDDDSAAIQAAVNFFKPYAQYEGKGISLRIPRGEGRIETPLDLTDAHGLDLFGAGRGSTYLYGIGNQPIIKWDNDSDLPLTNASVGHMTLVGPGYAQANGHGIQAGANNNCTFPHLRIWSCRNALDIHDSWQTTVDDIRIDGQGGLRSYTGIYMRDGNLAVAENSILVRQGLIQGCESYGFRAECLTGSKVFDLEVLGCSSTGVYIGDSPGGKDLKWFTWGGGLIDTCPHLLLVAKGTSTLCELLEIDLDWLGYASAGGGGGVGIQATGITNSLLGARLLTNTAYAINAVNCSKTTFRCENISHYDRLLGGGAAVIVDGTTDSSFYLGPMSKTAGSASTVALVEQNGAARNNYRAIALDGFISLLAAGNSSVSQDTLHKIEGVVRRYGPLPQAYEVGITLPPASAFFKDQIITVPNEAGGYTVAFCDGTDWRRVQDRVVVS